MAPAATNAPIGTPSTLGSLVNYKNVKWFEYQMNSDIGGNQATMTMREDFNTDFGGKNANKVTLNMNSGSGDSAPTTVMTSYTDPSSGATLGGHMKMTAGG